MATLQHDGLSTPFKESHRLDLNFFRHVLSDLPYSLLEHLTGYFDKYNFVQSSHDPCLFIGTNVICVVYIDEWLLFFSSQSDTDKAIKDT